MISYVSVLAYLLKGDYEREKVQQLHKELKRLEGKGLVSRQNNHYILTPQGWEIIGLFTKDAFYKIKRIDYKFQSIKFKWLKYLSLGKRGQDALTREYLKGKGFITRKNRMSPEALRLRGDTDSLINNLMQLSEEENRCRLEYPQDYGSALDFFKSNPSRFNRGLKRFLLQPNRPLFYIAK